MKKIITGLCASLVFVTMAFAVTKLTFTVEDVIEYAIKGDHCGGHEHNIDFLKSEAGRQCIQETIVSLNKGIVPEAIVKVYSKEFWFQDDDYTKDVIVHYCIKDDPFDKYMNKK